MNLWYIWLPCTLVCSVGWTFIRFTWQLKPGSFNISYPREWIWRCSFHESWYRPWVLDAFVQPNAVGNKHSLVKNLWAKNNERQTETRHYTNDKTIHQLKSLLLRWQHNLFFSPFQLVTSDPLLALRKVDLVRSKRPREYPYTFVKVLSILICGVVTKFAAAVWSRDVLGADVNSIKCCASVCAWRACTSHPLI
jgi:hypothetical protein